MNQYNPKEIEPKWQAEWEKQNLYKTPTNVTPENKMYILPQLPYPSGSGLHVGHAEVYTACDIYARYQRMMGKKVLQVIGWDSFGLPAENYAIKTNVHPRVSTNAAIDNFRSQIKGLGISVDWDREVGSHNSDYYKWTQWFFLLMYKQGLAYRKNQNVNWCDSCKTALANEQVTGEGKCERCDTVVVQRPMEQWYLKITDYADKLLEGLDRIDWPEETKMRQRNWIGRSEGAEVDFPVLQTAKNIRVFTTRPDTIFGATYLVVAPEHALVPELQSLITNWDEVKKYIDETKLKTDMDRQTQKEKSGVELKGLKAVNPVSGEEIPVWMADYVFASYGTGAIMAVPAHDERDFEFATKFGLTIRQVVKGPDMEITNQPHTGSGHLTNSDFLNGLSVEEAKKKIIEHLEQREIGTRKVQYKLRDWSVSRQRFWGAPIPMLHVENVSPELLEQYQQAPSSVLQLHAWGSSPADHFHPWLGEKLRAKNINVSTPELPEANLPVFEKWQAVAEPVVGDGNSIVIGRSLSCWNALKLAETHKLRKLVLIAPTLPTDIWYTNIRNFCDGDNMWEMLKTFMSTPVDFQKVQENVGEVVVILSTTDPYIDLASTQQFFNQHLPFARVTRMRNAGHFGAQDGFVEFPQLLQEVLAPVRMDLKALPETDLPVILPDDVDFKPTGQSPLMYAESFNAGVEEKYGKGWKREPDTLDTFMCSSWYYYRYLDPKNDGAFASPEALKTWMPVDFYLGGEEHVNGHLLYSRFFTKVLYDAGYITFDEPFTKTRHQGLILGEDNRKMSKRWGNVINPTDVINEYGADTMRVYEMFMGPLEQTKPWNTDSVKGVRRFFDRVWKLQEKVTASAAPSSEAERTVHLTVKKVGEDLSNMQYNTAIAKMMELVNVLSKEETIAPEHFELFIKILAPFAPHIAEEMWANQGHTDSVTIQPFPTHDAAKIVSDTLTIVVQVNGKVRASLEVDANITEEDITAQAIAQENVQKFLDGKTPQKVIYVKGKLVSIVV